VTGNWGRWGADDETGALNLVTADVTRHAVGLVRSGRTLSLAQPLGPPTAAPPHRQPPSRFMNRDAGDYALGARAPGGFRFAEDTVQFPTHSGTHVDALAHAWSGEDLYNGHPQSSTRTTRGAQRCGAEKLVPVVTRGVLVDVVAATGGPLAASAPVGVDEMRRGIAESGVTVGAGDAVLIRTGWVESQSANASYFEDEPGITEDAALWLADRDVALVGADNYAVEQQSAAGGFPAHLVLLHQHGVPLLENLALAELGEALAAESRSTFLFVFAPIPLVGSTGSPVNPVVVL
jgi:kynurenine formamidase